MSDYGYAVWGFAASILSTIFLVPLAYALISGGMPTAQMRELDALLSETEVLLSSAIREGTIDYRQYELTLNGDMWRYVPLGLDSHHKLSPILTSYVVLRPRSITYARKSTTSMVSGKSSCAGLEGGCLERSLKPRRSFTDSEARSQYVRLDLIYLNSEAYLQLPYRHVAPGAG